MEKKNPKTATEIKLIQEEKRNLKIKEILFQIFRYCFNNDGSINGKRMLEEITKYIK